jgi:two-component sensor histidine kinase
MEIDRDITQRRRAEDALKRSVRQLESALAEKTVLLKEIHHRVKNNLAVTASLLSMTADGSGPEARLALEESQQRVHSIALVHEYLYDNDRLDHINFGDYARDLAQYVYSAFGGQHKRIGLDLELDPIELGIERAVPCALILNELLSNAFKYAFAGGRTGRILVSFRQPEPGCCELTVEDDGVGLLDGALSGQSKSLGLRIVRILTNQLDGSVEQNARSGTRIVLRFPAAA